MKKGILERFPGFGVILLFAAFNFAAVAEAREETASRQPLLGTYHRLLPLEGGSNFRDLGGYPTESGKTVRRGQLFRSGAMTSLTAADQTYLEKFGIDAVVDLRSREELSLYPNPWVAAGADIDYVTHDYSMESISADRGEKMSRGEFMTHIYREFPQRLKPQLTMYFDRLLESDGPVVVNCSAGQDRTGMASALLLSVLGVPRSVIVEDYLLSTEFRDAGNELGGVDLRKAAEENAFARMMMRYHKDGQPSAPKPLMDDDHRAYISIAFDHIEKEYGSVDNYLDRELGVDKGDIARLRTRYIH